MLVYSAVIPFVEVLLDEPVVELFPGIDDQPFPAWEAQNDGEIVLGEFVRFDRDACKPATARHPFAHA